MTVLEKLNFTLLNREPVLFVGAGFSLGFKNERNKYLPTGSELARELYDKIASKCAHIEKLRKIFPNLESINLKEISTFIATQKDGKVERDRYLTKRFTGCYCDKNDIHMILKNYQWNDIYSLNIDDAIEYIYKDIGINVHTVGECNEVEQNKINLFKLHGSVSKPHHGYVFDDQEYRNYIANTPLMVRDFIDKFQRNDVIFLGTELQEEDVLVELERWKDKFSLIDTKNYFFISPNINSWKLEETIQNFPNFYHIKMNTKEFLQFLKDEIIPKERKKKRWRDIGLIEIEEEYKQFKPCSVNEGQLYLGELPTFFDFFAEWDIEYPNYQKWYKEIEKDESDQIVIFNGDSYVGKTCVSMRLVIDLYLKAGYNAIQYSLTSGIRKEQYFSYLNEYLTSLPKDSKCVVYTENMSSYFREFVDFIGGSHKYIKKLVFLLTVQEDDYRSKAYLLEKYDHVRKYTITYKVYEEYAKNIYQKLNEKNHLNKLTKIRMRDCIEKFMEINDIIEVLYYVSEGRKFDEYFSTWFSYQENEKCKKVFAAIGLLTELGIQDINVTDFLMIMNSIGYNIEFEDFRQQFKNFLKITENNTLYLRCIRILKKFTRKVLSHKERRLVLLAAAKYYANIIKDREESIESDIFQKLIKVKKIKYNKILSDLEILEVLKEAEFSLAHLSYYWIQKGIAFRNLKQFEEANNAFEKAGEVRKNESYNIMHAKAKNYLEWGVDSAKTDLGKSQFNKGLQQLKDLMRSSPIQFFAYSVHTYVDMTIKFYNVTKEIPSKKEIDFIIENLMEFNKKFGDLYSSSILINFINFCKKNKIRINNEFNHDSNIYDCDEYEIDIDDIDSSLAIVKK